MFVLCMYMYTCHMCMHVNETLLFYVFISLIVIDIVNVLISTNVCFMYVYVYMSYVHAC